MPFVWFAPLLAVTTAGTITALVWLLLNARSVAILYALRPGPGPVRAGRTATLAALWAFALSGAGSLALMGRAAAGLV